MTQCCSISLSTTIEKLDVGATQLTSQGLKYLCNMIQLRALDIWVIDFNNTDLHLLTQLPKLEYLSIGHFDKQTKLTAQAVIPFLKILPSLKQIWLDGIPVTARGK
jgi:hypothetical protein